MNDDPEKQRPSDDMNEQKEKLLAWLGFTPEEIQQRKDGIEPPSLKDLLDELEKEHPKS